MRRAELGVSRQSRLVCRNCTVHISLVGELHAALQHRGSILPQRGDGGEHRVIEGRPARAVPFVQGKRRSRVVHAAECPIGQRQRVVCGAQLGEQRHGASQGADGGVMLASGGRDPSEPDFSRR